MMLGLLIFLGLYWLGVWTFWRLVKSQPCDPTIPLRWPTVTTKMNGNRVVRVATRRGFVLRDMETGIETSANAEALLSCRPKNIRAN